MLETIILKEKKYADISSMENVSSQLMSAVQVTWQVLKRTSLYVINVKKYLTPKHLLMKHRKSSHKIKQCNEFINETCRHGDELCLYMHIYQDFNQVNLRKNSTIDPTIKQTNFLNQTKK